MNPAKPSNKKYHQGLFTPRNPNKIIGDTDKLIYRSSWEKRVCIQFDENPAIKRWGMECLKISYRSPKDGLRHTYYPDFLIVSETNGKESVTVIEVKPEAQRHPPKKQGKRKSRFLFEAMQYEINQAKWEAARKYCSDRGWNFVVLTEKQIQFNK